MAYKPGEKTVTSVSTPSGRTLEQAAADAARAAYDLGIDRGRSYLATVTAVFTGFVYATIDGVGEVTVLTLSKAFAVGDVAFVKKFDNSPIGPYVAEDYASESDENGVQYCWDVETGESTTRRFYAEWGGTIKKLVEDGATFTLTAGGVSVGVGDAIAAGTWVTMTASADGSGVSVTIG